MKAFADLPIGVQQHILSLYCPEILELPNTGLSSLTETNRRLLLILEVCCSGLPSGWAGLFEHVAYVNHSCAPNAAIRVSVASGLSSQQSCCQYRIRFVALRAISKGEEITISYIEEGLLKQPVRSRQRYLRSWGFRCACARCAALCDDTRQIRHGKWTLSASSETGLLAAWPSGLPYNKMSRLLQKIESRWWRERADLPKEREAAEDARMRRFAVGLGTERIWRQRGGRLRRSCWMSRTLDLYQQTKDSSHWLAADIARDAAEAYLWRAEPARSVEAAGQWHSFLKAVLAGGLSHEAALALEARGAALEMQSLGEQAKATYQNALCEIQPLRNNWDDEDFFASYLERKVAMM